MDALIKWLILVALLVAVPMLQRSIVLLEKRQTEIWAEGKADRADLRATIMEINAKLAVRPDQVLEQVKAMRQEHHEMQQLLSPEMREAWHKAVHEKRQSTPAKMMSR
jgi:predicted PurR-regulated permease PerM